jgi:hypothetical protein
MKQVGEIAMEGIDELDLAIGRAKLKHIRTMLLLLAVAFLPARSHAAWYSGDVFYSEQEIQSACKSLRLITIDGNQIVSDESHRNGASCNRLMKDFDHWSYKTFRAAKHPFPEIDKQWVEDFEVTAGQLCSKLFAAHSGQKPEQANQVCMWSDVNSERGRKTARGVIDFTIGHALVPYASTEQLDAEVSKQDFYSALGLSEDNSETKVEFLRSLDGAWRYCNFDQHSRSQPSCRLSLSWIVCCNSKVRAGQMQITLKTSASQELKLELSRSQLFH